MNPIQRSNEILSSISILPQINVEISVLENHPILKKKTIEKVLYSSNRTSQGGYGAYFPISKTKGIKLLFPRFYSKDAALSSDAYVDAKGESNLLNRAREKFRRVPKSFGVRIVFYEGMYRIAIVMQHLEGNTGDLLGMDRSSFEMQELAEELKAHGITHNDLHAANAIIHKGEWWVIDFSPDFITISED